MQLGMWYCKVLIFHFHYLGTFCRSVFDRLRMKMAVPWVNYSTWKHILCSKVGAENIKKIRHDHLCKTSQWPFIFDSSQLYLVSHKKVWLTVCRSPPVIPTDTCALNYLSLVEEHIKRRLKLKLKNKVIQCMVKSADDKLYPEIQNKNF